MDSIQHVITQFVGAIPTSALSRILSAIEDHPVPLHSETDRRKGGQFGAKLRKLQPYGHQLGFGSVVHRQAFLWGAANYFKGLPHEELIVGFGVTHGKRTRINSVMKIRGEAAFVALPADKAAIVHGYLNEDNRHSAILVHNHPGHHPVLCLLSLIFGLEPLPSMADRRFGLNALSERLRSNLQGAAFGTIRFFVVQNDELREFSGLAPALLLDAITFLCALPIR